MADSLLAVEGAVYDPRHRKNSSVLFRSRNREVMAGLGLVLRAGGVPPLDDGMDWMCAPPHLMVSFVLLVDRRFLVGVGLRSDGCLQVVEVGDGRLVVEGDVGWLSDEVAFGVWLKVNGVEVPGGLYGEVCA